MTALHISMGGTRALPLDLLLAAIPSLPRAALNALVDQAIERMDEDDGDPDLEFEDDMGVDDIGEDDRAGDC